MKSNDLLVNVLKKLNYNPDHGYNIYTKLKEDCQIKNPSELYKILRNMESKGLIEVIAIEKENGRNRKILAITQKGRDKYYNIILNSAFICVDLLYDALVYRANILIAKKFKEKRYRKYFETENTILADLEIPIEHQMNFLKEFAGLFKEKQRVYLPNPYLKNQKFRQLPDNLEYTILDEHMSLKPNSVDVIFSTGCLFYPRIEGPESWIDLLKPDGKVILLLFSKPFRNATDNAFYLVKLLVKSLIDQEMSKEAIPDFLTGFLKNQSETAIPTFPKIKQVLSKYFDKINVLDEKAQLNYFTYEVIVAEHPIRRENLDLSSIKKDILEENFKNETFCQFKESMVKKE